MGCAQSTLADDDLNDSHSNQEENELDDLTRTKAGDEELRGNGGRKQDFGWKTDGVTSPSVTKQQKKSILSHRKESSWAPRPTSDPEEAGGAATSPRPKSSGNRRKGAEEVQVVGSEDPGSGPDGPTLERTTSKGGSKSGSLVPGSSLKLFLKRREEREKDGAPKRERSWRSSRESKDGDSGGGPRADDEKDKPEGGRSEGSGQSRSKNLGRALSHGEAAKTQAEKSPAELSAEDRAWLYQPLLECCQFLGSKGRIEVMGFEIANVIVRAIRLRQGLQEPDLKALRENVVCSEGIRTLVSTDTEAVWLIAGFDKRDELRSIARDVARLGRNTRGDYRDLGTILCKLGTDRERPWKVTDTEETERIFKRLESRARATADLYNEMSSLEGMQKALTKRLKDPKPALHEIVQHMRVELKKQERKVHEKRAAGLWDVPMDQVVRDLMNVTVFLHFAILDVFGEAVLQDGPLVRAEAEGAPAKGQRPAHLGSREPSLGDTGMALHYANIVTIVDKMVLRSSVVQNRDALYTALPRAVRQRLKKQLLSSGSLESQSTQEIRERLESTLDWLATMAENTVKVGVDKRLQGHTDVTLLETLHHARETGMQSLLLRLLVDLQHLAAREEQGGDLAADLDLADQLHLLPVQEEARPVMQDWKPVPKFAIVAPIPEPRPTQETQPLGPPAAAVKPQDAEDHHPSLLLPPGGGTAARPLAASDGGDGAAEQVTEGAAARSDQTPAASEASEQIEDSEPGEESSLDVPTSSDHDHVRHEVFAKAATLAAPYSRERALSAGGSPGLNLRAASVSAVEGGPSVDLVGKAGGAEEGRVRPRLGRLGVSGSGPLPGYRQGSTGRAMGERMAARLGHRREHTIAVRGMVYGTMGPHNPMFQRGGYSLEFRRSGMVDFGAQGTNPGADGAQTSGGLRQFPSENFSEEKRGGVAPWVSEWSMVSAEIRGIFEDQFRESGLSRRRSGQRTLSRSVKLRQGSGSRSDGEGSVSGGSNSMYGGGGSGNLATGVAGAETSVEDTASSSGGATSWGIAVGEGSGNAASLGAGEELDIPVMTPRSFDIDRFDDTEAYPFAAFPERLEEEDDSWALGAMMASQEDVAPVLMGSRSRSKDEVGGTDQGLGN